MEKVKVYVGCALTHASVRYKAKINAFKDELRKYAWIQVLDFWNANPMSHNQPIDPVAIYYTDIHECVGNADVIIGELSSPSLGLGWELGTCVEKYQIRTIMCAKNSALVSNLPLGSAMHSLNCNTVSMVRYKKSLLELMPYFIEELQKVYNNIYFNEILDT